MEHEFKPNEINRHTYSSNFVIDGNRAERVCHRY